MFTYPLHLMVKAHSPESFYAVSYIHTIHLSESRYVFKTAKTADNSLPYLPSTIVGTSF